MTATAPGYLVCTHPRSGSTWLCQLLESTGCLGRPNDYFNAGYMRRRFSEDAGNPAHLPDQVRFYLDHAATDNGLRAAKLFWFDFVRLARAGLTRHFAGYRFVLLERDDKIAQAVSSSRALRSGKMWAEGAASDEHVEYDYAHIGQRLANLLHAERQWQAFFARNRIEPLRVIYETLARDPQVEIDRVARHVGIETPAPIDPSQIRARVQRDQRSSEWRQRFIDEARRNDPALLQPRPAARRAGG